MTAKRFLLGAIVMVLLAGTTVGQGPAASRGPVLPDSPFPPIQGGIVPVAGFESPSLPIVPVPPVPDSPTATSVLTGTPATQSNLPPGTVASPWCGGAGLCCGPVGGSGPLTYEIYATTGLSLPVAGGGFIGRLQTGWETGGVIRTLWFNVPGTAAWVLNAGLTYTYNRGDEEQQLQVFTPQPRDATGQLLGPDQLNVFVIRGLHRTNFTLAIGRDWWYTGPGFVGTCTPPGWRFGVDFGGRWGTAHVDLIPVDDQDNYLRRSGVTQSVIFGAHLDREIEMGAWKLFTGLRTEYDYTWTNLIPDHNGDLVSINLLLYLGARF